MKNETTTPKKPLSLSKDTTNALRIKTGLKAGPLGQNPGNQGHA
jgi:hypothetical protein